MHGEEYSILVIADSVSQIKKIEKKGEFVDFSEKVAENPTGNKFIEDTRAENGKIKY